MAVTHFKQTVSCERTLKWPESRVLFLTAFLWEEFSSNRKRWIVWNFNSTFEILALDNNWASEVNFKLWICLRRTDTEPLFPSSKEFVAFQPSNKIVLCYQTSTATCNVHLCKNVNVHVLCIQLFCKYASISAFPHYGKFPRFQVLFTETFAYRPELFL